MSIVDIVIIIVYMLGMLGIGVYARFKIKSVDDFLVAGHRFNMFSLVGTLMAALLGAGMTLGMVGGVYSYGGGILWNYIGFAIGLAAMAIFFVKPMRRTGKRTLAEVVGHGFGRLPRFCAAVVVVVYTTCLTALTIQGMGRIISYVAWICGWDVSIDAMVVVCAVIVIGYTALGGLYSVVWTDVVQFVIMIGVVIVAGPIIAITTTGGIDVMADAVVNTTGGAELFSLVEGVPISYICYAAILLIVATPGDPTVPQRALAGSTTKITQKSFAYSAVLCLIFGVGLLFIGGAAVVLIPDIVELYGTTEAAFPMMIISYFPPVIKGLGISALLAAVMSTISAMTLVGTTHLVYDAPRAIKPDIKDETLKKVLPIAIAVYGIVVTYIALGVESIATFMYMAFSIAGAAFLFPMIMALYWKKASKWGVTMSILGGFITVFIMHLTGNMGFGDDPFYTGFLVSVVCGLVFSFAIPGREENVEYVQEVVKDGQVIKETISK